MRTITAPGVEIQEQDLSFYDFPLPKEETQNVFINGFATQGHNNFPYEFTNKNTDDDLIATFGTPTNEAERYFFNACSEAIKRDKTVLYATRLPYSNTATQNYNCVEYRIDNNVKQINAAAEISDVYKADETLSTYYYAEINQLAAKSIPAEDIEKYRTTLKKPNSNRFIIVDKNQEIYQKIPQDAKHMELSTRYLLGVLPIVTTATNAMYYQKLIKAVDENYTYLSGEEIVPVSANLSVYEPTNAISSVGANAEITPSLMVYPANSSILEDGNKSAMTLSKYAMGFFPTIDIQPDGSFARDRLDNIGVVVFKGFVDAESGNKIKYEPVEAFAGSLRSDSVDPTTGTSRFIDDIINTNSKTIEFYSNCFNNSKFTTTASFASFASSEVDGKTVKKQVFKAGSADVATDKVALLHINNKPSVAVGFAEADAKEKTISFGLIMSSLDKIFEKNKDINEKQIDLVVDAGVGNIADFMFQVNSKIDAATDPNVWLKNYDPTAYQEDGDKVHSAVELWDICTRVGDGAASVAKSGAVDKWTLVQKKYDAFCKLRGDCMFLSDGLRPLCICGNRKRVRATDFNTTVPRTISPFMKYITGKIDTSYGTGNCDWYQIVDPTSGVNMWMPPSVKTMCSMLDNFNRKTFWTPPAGVNNGRLNPIDNPSKVAVIDIAFSPTVKDAGDIYTKCWNYATYYKDDGFVLEGQRTFQSRPTAFDRINVRRVFLYLERKVALAGKYFLYEGNTAYQRQRFVDAITPYFEDCRIKEGIADYRIVCDDTNNTSDTIDRNELHVKVAIKPVKAIEFIVCEFVCLRTGASWTEAGINA